MSICYVCGKLGTPSNPASVAMQIDGNPVNAHKSCAEEHRAERRTAERVTSGTGALLLRPDRVANRVGELIDLTRSRNDG